MAKNHNKNALKSLPGGHFVIISFMQSQVTTDKMTFRDTLRTYSRLLKSGFSANKVAFPGLFVLLAFASVLPFLTSFLSAKVIDELGNLISQDVSERSVQTLVFTVILFGLNDVFVSVLWSLVSLADKYHYFGISRLFENQFLEKFSQLDSSFFQDKEKSNLIYRAREVYVDKPRDVLNRSIWMIGDLIRIITSFFIVISFSFPAFLIILITTLPSLIVNTKLGTESWSIWDANATDRNRYYRSRNILTSEKSIIELRIFKTFKYLLDFMFGIFDTFTNKERKNAIRRTILESVITTLSNIGTISFYIIAINSALNGDITIGILTFYVASTGSFSAALSNLFRQLSKQSESILYVKQFFDFLDLPTEIKDGTKTIDVSSGINIEFKDVWFKYPNTERYVLKNLNIKFNTNEKVALVGENGAGKSTLLSLLARVYDVNKGEILLNGVNIKEIKLDFLYDQIGILFQNFVRYDHLDLKTNVKLGDFKNQEDEEKIKESLYKADAQRFVDEYPGKLDQILDKALPGGIEPSMGQWQRIALARAFYRNSPILILDEPTAAIDAKGEYEIFERLFEFSKDKTVIIVSHRFSTVRKADKIFVVDHGSILEQGTHEELLKLNGKYAEAFNLQAEGYR